MLEDRDIHEGKVYIVAGQGPMYLRERILGGTLLFLGHGGGQYWASSTEVVRECSKQDMLAYEKSKAERRSVNLGIWPCEDPHCWCREMPTQHPSLHGDHYIEERETSNDREG